MICLIRAFLQFCRRLDKLQPFCRIAGHTSEEVRDILAILEAVFQQLFPQLNLHQWAGTIYAWLTHPVLGLTHSGRVTMDNLMKLVTTALKWTYEAGETNIRAERLKSAAELLVLLEDKSAETKDRANGNEPERQVVQENEQQNPTETVGTAKEPVQTSPAPRCPFSRTVIPIDLKRFTDSGVSSVECPDCGRTRSLSPSKGILRFSPHEPRKSRPR